jgi:hypothetical protein
MTGLTPDITAATIVSHGVLGLTFADGLTAEIDVLDRMRGPIFADARTTAGFAKVAVDAETGPWSGPAEPTSRPTRSMSARRLARGQGSRSRHRPPARHLLTSRSGCAASAVRMPAARQRQVSARPADRANCASVQPLGEEPTPSRRVGQDCMNVSRSALIVSAWVVGMPCGKPLYVFSVPFCTSSADSGPESS